MTASSILLRIFRSSQLARGANRIEQVEPTSSFEVGIALFVATASLLASRQKELYVVDDRKEQGNDNSPSGDFVDACVREAIALGLAEVWLMSDIYRERRTFQIGGVHVNVVQSATILRSLIDLPQEAAERFCFSGKTDIRFLNATYRRRYATTFDFDSNGRALRRAEKGVDLDHRFATWAASLGSPKPILLLGDRGSGKTWQLLRFCVDQSERNRKDPIGAPPAVYVSLHNWATQWAEHEAVDLYSLVVNQCSWIEVKWDSPMLQALVAQGRVIICFDGFDEIQRQPNAQDVQEHMIELFRILPPGSRFVMASRTTLFDSFTGLARLSTWPASTLGSSVDVLELQLFSPDDVRSYLQAVKVATLPDNFESESFVETHNAIADAVQCCFQQPGLLAHLRASPLKPKNRNGLEAIREIIEGALISFNLDLERTKVVHRDQSGTLHAFAREQRVSLLGELAWFMTERHLSNIDLNALPIRLSLIYGIDSDALRRDIRSQTVFELDAASDRGPKVNFGIHYPSDHSRLGTAQTGSVAKDYFLATHIYTRIKECIDYGQFGFGQAMRFLGSVELSELCATLLCEMCAEGPQQLRSKNLADSVPKWLSGMAKKRHYEVFGAQYRYLVSNLQKLGSFSAEDAAIIDPWTKIADVIQTRPAALSSYEMVLIPECTSKEIRNWARSEKGCTSETGDAQGPFLVGLHEITNKHFLRFIDDPKSTGRDWSIERVTRAGSRGTAQSEFASKTNEYHLYYWDKDDSGRYQPHLEHQMYPVVYVSWFAALAFCDWLTATECRGEAQVLTPERGRSIPKSGNSPASHYRLPTAVEWRWAAQGPYLGAEYPWELVPYPLPALSRIPTSISNYRSAVKSVALGRHGRTKAVAYEDEVSLFGVAGLIGNVKEWVQDTIPGVKIGSPLDVAIVLGSTAHLDESSFRFEYFARLFPENTNPDVGFRVGRSLSDKEMEALTSRQEVLAGL